MRAKLTLALFIITALLACSKKSNDNPSPPVGPTTPDSYSFNALTVNGVFSGFNYTGVNTNPVIKITFSTAIDRNTVANNITFKTKAGVMANYTTTFEDNDNTVVLTATGLSPITAYTINVATTLKSAKNGNLQSAITVNLLTAVDPADKFPVISDNELLDLVQKQTFKYFWDFGHPTSGLARERNTSGDVVTSGGSGFGIMAIVTAVNRNFITRAEGFARLQKIVGFLKNTAQTVHGAYPHWLNGTTGAIVPFSTKDNGADLVETSYLMQGLLTARQYFNAGGDEATLRADINTIYNRVEWNFFRKGGENVLYWHYSPNYTWDMNMKIQGWNEALITYVMAASSPTYGIPKEVYDNGWARNGAMKNGNTYYGVQLPLGSANGGPLFFAHYSFMGINPNGLIDAYANYETQNKAHALINYNYCKANPKGYYGYGENVWGLTASDINGGYTASDPNNDVGVIAPTAALASMPYTPTQSMAALKYFYYKLGDKLWGQYGFYDAFSLNEPWFANSYLAIDQGPIIVMIENHRSGLLWNLFMSCPEVKTGMRSLGFSSPSL